MTTAFIWLLISIGMEESRSATPTQVVERFVTEQECERVRGLLRVRSNGNPALRCIQATVVRP